MLLASTSLNIDLKATGQKTGVLQKRAQTTQDLLVEFNID